MATTCSRRSRRSSRRAPEEDRKSFPGSLPTSKQPGLGTGSGKRAVSELVTELHRSGKVAARKRPKDVLVAKISLGKAEAHLQKSVFISKVPAG